MNIKKLLLLSAIITLSFILTSCNILKPKLGRDDKKIAETRLEEIINALENNAKEILKNMFSTNALEEADDIDNNIDYVMNFYKGTIISKEGSRQGLDSNSDGIIKSELKGFYRVTTDKEKYIIFFIDQLVDTENTDNVGLYMLQIIKLEDREKYFDWGNETRCAGIFRTSDEKIN